MSWSWCTWVILVGPMAWSDLISIVAKKCVETIIIMDLYPVEGHLNPTLFNPKLQPIVSSPSFNPKFQPQVSSPNFNPKFQTILSLEIKETRLFGWEWRNRSQQHFHKFPFFFRKFYFISKKVWVYIISDNFLTTTSHYSTFQYRFYNFSLICLHLTLPQNGK